MPPIRSGEFRARFWTAQLIAGSTLAMKTAHWGWHEGGFWIASLMGLGGFLAVMPLAVGVVWLLLRTGMGYGPAHAEVRWVGAVSTGLILCGLIFGAALLLSS